MDDLKRFWNRLKLQAQENPVLTLAVVTALLTATTKFAGLAIEMRNSRAWAKEVSRRAMKDAMRR
jgi:hypothetical protein